MPYFPGPWCGVLHHKLRQSAGIRREYSPVTVWWRPIIEPARSLTGQCGDGVEQATLSSVALSRIAGPCGGSGLFLTFLLAVSCGLRRGLHRCAMCPTPVSRVTARTHTGTYLQCTLYRTLASLHLQKASFQSSADFSTIETLRLRANKAGRCRQSKSRTDRMAPHKDFTTDRCVQTLSEQVSISSQSFPTTYLHRLT